MSFGEFLTSSWAIYCEMAPYLLFGFFLAGLAFAYIPPGIIKKRLGEKGFYSTIKGALYGVPLPLCSCSTLPMAMALRRQGASLGAVGSFLISTPQTGVDSIIVTWSMLGPLFAIFRAVAAFISGLFGGFILEFFEGLKEKSSNVNSKSVDRNEACSSTCSCTCGESPCEGDSENQEEKGGFRQFLDFGFRELPEEIGPSLIFGVLVGGLIASFVPDSHIESALHPGISGLLFSMALGIPLYVCATSSVPIALALLLKGASPGAAFVFLMTGPVTNTAQLSAIYSVFGKRNLLIYLVVVAISALFFGTVLDSITSPMAFKELIAEKEFLPEFIQVPSALLLSVLIVRSLYKKRGQGACCG